jgi:hypothetical protein
MDYPPSVPQRLHELSAVERFTNSILVAIFYIQDRRAQIAALGGTAAGQPWVIGPRWT